MRFETSRILRLSILAGVVRMRGFCGLALSPSLNSPPLESAVVVTAGCHQTVSRRF